jgi:hypothetical protein
LHYIFLFSVLFQRTRTFFFTFQFRQNSEPFLCFQFCYKERELFFWVLSNVKIVNIYFSISLKTRYFLSFSNFSFKNGLAFNHPRVPLSSCSDFNFQFHQHL